MKLKNSYRIRLSDDDLMLLKELKALRIKPTTFIRQAIREKIKSQLPQIIRNEKIRNQNKPCPF